MALILGIAKLAMLFKPLGRFIKRVQHANSKFTLANKLKIVIAFYMVATKAPSVYDVTLPDDVMRFLSRMSFSVSFGLDVLATTPLECIGAEGFVPLLLFWMVVPPCAICLIPLFSALARLSARSGLFKHRERRAAAKAANARGRLDQRQITGRSPTPSHRERGLDVAGAVERTAPWLLRFLFLLYPVITNLAVCG